MCMTVNHENSVRYRGYTQIFCKQASVIYSYTHWLGEGSQTVLGKNGSNPSYRAKNKNA